MARKSHIYAWKPWVNIVLKGQTFHKWLPLPILRTSQRCLCFVKSCTLSAIKPLNGWQWQKCCYMWYAVSKRCNFLHNSPFIHLHTLFLAVTHQNIHIYAGYKLSNSLGFFFCTSSNLTIQFKCQIGSDVIFIEIPIGWYRKVHCMIH